jgi:hypothetical protein
MPGEPPLEPWLVVSRCEHCHSEIRFDVVQLAGRAVCRVPCPHCGRETSLQAPAQPPAARPPERRAPSRPVGEPPPHLAETVLGAPVSEPPPVTVTLPPDPPPPRTRAPMDVRWLTDLGVVYFRQHQFGEAFHCFQRAAQQGFATAQFCLAVCYFNGHGIAPDAAAALPWLHKAAAQGDANAEFTLGLAYRLGQGVAADESLAQQWLHQAAQHGHPEAARSLREKPPVPKPQNQPAPAPAAPAKILPERAPEKGPVKPSPGLQRLILGLFRKP